MPRIFLNRIHCIDTNDRFLHGSTDEIGCRLVWRDGSTSGIVREHANVARLGRDEFRDLNLEVGSTLDPALGYVYDFVLFERDDANSDDILGVVGVTVNDDNTCTFTPPPISVEQWGGRYAFDGSRARYVIHLRAVS